MRFLAKIVVLNLIGTCLGFAQESDTTQAGVSSTNGRIEASVEFDRNEVPQNRTTNLIVKVSWEGDLERYEIEKLDYPALSNFEIVSNSTSNWVGELNGVKKVIKTYEFELKPVSLGMAYVDGMIVEYVDMESGKQGHLLTNRLEATVVAPIRERSAKPWILGGGIAVAVLLFFGGVIQYRKRKREKEAAERAQAIQSVPLEEKYAAQLKDKVDLKNNDIVETFSTLSRLLRSYLSDRYGISARGMATTEIGSELTRLAVPQKMIEQVQEVLNSCDVAKFSGGGVEKSVVERAYTLVERILAENGTSVNNKQNQGAGAEKDK